MISTQNSRSPPKHGLRPRTSTSCPESSQKSKSWVNRQWVFTTLLVAAVFLWKWYWFGKNTAGSVNPEGAPKATNRAKEWGDITPSERLLWEPCFGEYGDEFKCARLTVPMDYHRPLSTLENNPKVQIALVMLPGKNRTSFPSSYGQSPVLINPGGPGGSGTMFALSAAGRIQTIVGDNYDIIGFDPRGVGATTPYANCFTREETSSLPGDILERNRALMNRMTWLVSGHDVGLVNSSDVALEKLNTRNNALSQLCKEADNTNGNNSIYRYVSTPNVARDMLSIIDAWDEWRATASNDIERSMTEPTDTKGNLVYWGFSYGTLLGATFSAMFPDRVGRVILDGVVDADHYVGHAWVDSLQDADAIWDKFFIYCFEAKKHCALYRDGDKVGDIRTRFDNIRNNIIGEPLFGTNVVTVSPLVINWSDIKSLLFRSLYSPIDVFPGIAILFDYIDRGVDVMALLGGYFPNMPALCHISKLPQWPDDALISIMCSDKRYKMNETLPQLEQTFEHIAKYSEFADIWMTLMLGCNGWSIEAKDPPMRWDDHPISKLPPVKTSFPVLFLSSHLDPVTPLQAALKMTKKFVNSTIIEQKSEGHCTIACPSLCTAKKIRSYLDQGIVPTPPKFDQKKSSTDKITGQWTTCGCDAKPFKIPEDGVAAMSNEDQKILEGLQVIQKAVHEHGIKHDIFQQNPLREMMLGL